MFHLVLFQIRDYFLYVILYTYVHVYSKISPVQCEQCHSHAQPQEWSFGTGSPIDVLFPGEDHFFHSQYSLVAGSYLCTVEAL